MNPIIISIIIGVILVVLVIIGLVHHIDEQKKINLIADALQVPRRFRHQLSHLLLYIAKRDPTVLTIKSHQERGLMISFVFPLLRNKVRSEVDQLKQIEKQRDLEDQWYSQQMIDMRNSDLI